MNYFIIGFYFGLGFVVANTILTVVDKVLATLLLRYKMKKMLKLKSTPKPPEGLNFGNKIK